MEPDPRLTDLLSRQSSVDDAWNKLSDYQKIQLMTAHTKEFNLTKEELKETLLTLPFTEQEINAAYASNNGGGVFYAENDKTGDRTVTSARVDKFHSDGTATITTLVLDHLISASVDIVNIEDYVPETHGAIDADILTRYTIYKVRCEELGYPVDLALNQLIKDFHKTFNTDGKITARDKNIGTYILGAYVDGLAVTTAPLQLGQEVDDDILYSGDRDERERYVGVEDEWEMMYYDISDVLMKITGVDVVAGNSQDLFEGYDKLPYRDVKALKVWIANNFKKNGVLYREGMKSNNIRICGKWIDINEYSFRSLVKEINILLVPCEHKLDIAYAEDNRSDMWVKLTKL